MARKGPAPPQTDSDKRIAGKVFPKGTVFRRSRGTYRRGTYTPAGELSDPLKKDGPAPGPGWEVAMLGEPEDADTMSALQGKRAQKPTGA